MSQLRRWFKKHEKKLLDAIDLSGSGYTSPALSRITVLNLICVGLLELSVDKDNRCIVTD